MPSHVNITCDAGSIRAEAEAQLNRDKTLRHGVDYFGPDTGAPKVPASQDFCDRLAQAAREKGRPLSQTEIAMVAEGKTLPSKPIDIQKRSIEEQVVARLLSLEKAVALLIDRIDALEASRQKKSGHLAAVETR